MSADTYAILSMVSAVGMSLHPKLPGIFLWGLTMLFWLICYAGTK